METEASMWPLRSKSRALTFWCEQLWARQSCWVSKIFFSGKILNTIVILLWRFPSHFLLKVDECLLRSKRLSSYSPTNCGNIYHQSCASPQTVCFVLLSHLASAAVPFLQAVTRYFRIAFLHAWHWESHLMHPEKTFATKSSFIMTLRRDKYSRVAITSLEVISRESRNRSLLNIYGNL